MKTEVFLDTAYAIALSSPKDEVHYQALQLAEEIETAGIRLVTTQAVLLEIGNALSKQRYRRVAVRLLHSLETDPQVEIVALSQSLYGRAFHLYSDRLDKEWGLIDCVSFVVMRERGIMEALTTDKHFQQAGFLALLRQK